MSPISSPGSQPTTWKPPSPFNLAAMALFFALLGLAIAYLLAAAANNRAPLSASVWSEPVVEKILAGTPISAPAAWVHPPSPNGENVSDQLELNLNLRFGPAARLFQLDVHLVALSTAQPSFLLLDALYRRQFSSRQLNSVPGLVGKPLNPMLGFEDETVWYDPLSRRPFTAKCLGGGSDGAPATCLRTVRLTNRLAAVYRFDAGLLAHWRNFDAAVQPVLERIGVFSTL